MSDNNMRIHKPSAKTQFLVMRNDDIQRKDLSYEAIGLLTYLCSLPDDWDIKISTLYRKGAKRDKMQRMIKELRDAGYMRLVRVQGDDGRFIDTYYEVYGMPEDNPDYEPKTGKTVKRKNRETEKPKDGKPTSTKEIENTKEIVEQKKEKEESVASATDAEINETHLWILSDPDNGKVHHAMVDVLMGEMRFKNGGQAARTAKSLLKRGITPLEVHYTGRFYEMTYSLQAFPRTIGKIIKYIDEMKKDRFYGTEYRNIQKAIQHDKVTLADFAPRKKPKKQEPEVDPSELIDATDLIKKLVSTNALRLEA